MTVRSIQSWFFSDAGLVFVMIFTAVICLKVAPQLAASLVLQVPVTILAAVGLFASFWVLVVRRLQEHSRRRA